MDPPVKPEGDGLLWLIHHGVVDQGSRFTVTLPLKPAND